MIAEAAYYLAQKRAFHGVHALDDWLAAEQQVRQAISPVPNSEANMSSATRQNQRKSSRKALEATEKAGVQAKHDQNPPQHQSASRFEKFAATQATGDGIEGDVLKPGKTIDEKLGANMTDRR